MKLKPGILAMKLAEQILVPFNAKIGMQSALHQHPRATECYRLINLFADFIDGAHVGIWRAGPSIEGAERAHDITHVRVVDIAIDDVSDDVSGMLSLTNLVCGRANASYVV